MAEDLQELVIKLRADVQGLKASLTAAKAETETFAGGMKGIMGGLKAEFAEVFAIVKLAEWVREGISSFASFDQALDKTIDSVNRFDKSANTSKEKVAEWGEAIEKQTLFTKNEAVESLSKLVTMTGNFKDAQGLSKTAMDFATVAHVDLQTATQALGNAYGGNLTAVRGLTRNMPELARALAEGKDIFQALREQGIDGASEAMNQGLAGSLNQGKKAFEDMFEKVGEVMAGPLAKFIDGTVALFESIMKLIEFLQPLIDLFFAIGEVIRDLITGVISFAVEQFSDMGDTFSWVGDVLDWLKNAFIVFGKTVLAIIKSAILILKELIAVFKFFGAVVTAVFKSIYDAMHFHFIDAWKGLKEGVSNAAKELAEDTKKNSESFKEAWTTSIESTGHAAQKAGKHISSFAGHGKAAIKQGQDTIETITKTVSSFHDALQKEMTVEQMSISQAMALYNEASKTFTITLDKNSKTYKQDKEAFEKMVKEREDIIKKAAKVIADQMKDMAKAVGGAIESSFEKMTAGLIKGTMTIGQAFETLGKNILKSMLGVFADILIKEGEATMTRGAAAILEGNPAAASGLFASGAMKMAEGGIIKGFAEAALAEGGIVTKPTVALIGEAGPEKVIPLNRAGADASGGMHFNAPINLPNVRDPRQFIQELQRMKARAGYRYTSF